MFLVDCEVGIGEAWYDGLSRSHAKKLKLYYSISETGCSACL